MGVEPLTSDEVAEAATAALGLDPSALDPLGVEGMAASLRRAASFLCPATPSMLSRAVDEALRGLRGYSEDTRPQLEAVLDSLVSYGDLLELAVDDEGVPRRRLFLGAPAFVRRATDTCLLMGVRPEGASLVGEALLARVEYDAHIRFIRGAGTQAVADLLAAEGLMELQPDQWLRVPARRATLPEDLVALYSARLDAARQSGVVEDIRIIDPVSPVTYYRGRWRSPKNTDRGRYVVRRPQAFGADLWCFAEVVGGEVMRLIDFPIQIAVAPAADEAWRLQAAIDALAGRPQRVRVRPAARAGWSTLDLFSPIPSWMQRRLDIIGTPLLRTGGALLSYAVPENEADEELKFLRDMMWIAEAPAEGTVDG